MLQSMRSQRLRYNLVTEQQHFLLCPRRVTDSILYFYFLDTKVEVLQNQLVSGTKV